MRDNNGSGMGAHVRVVREGPAEEPPSRIKPKGMRRTQSWQDPKEDNHKNREQHVQRS